MIPLRIWSYASIRSCASKDLFRLLTTDDSGNLNGKSAGSTEGTCFAELDFILY